MPLVTLLGGEPKSIPTYGSLKMMSPDRAIGGERKLMVDYNQSLSVVEATRRVRVLDEGGLFWIEEAVKPWLAQ